MMSDLRKMLIKNHCGAKIRDDFQVTYFQVTQRGLSCARQRAASSNLDFCFVSTQVLGLHTSSLSY